MLINNQSLFYISQALICLPFYAIGFRFKTYLTKPEFNLKSFLALLSLWLILMLLFYKGPQNISINLITQNIISFYIIAISGSIVLVEICKLFSNKWLLYYGKISIVPMLVQMPFIWLLANLYEVDNIIIYFLFAIIACVLSGACIPIFRNKYYDIFK